MTVEEKAKAYDEAIERAKKVHNEHKAQPFDVMLKIFPELKESEDGQHRKWILEYLYDGLQKSDEQFKGQFKAAIAWLEKQGEQKPADKVEPKFKIGDLVKYTNHNRQPIYKVNYIDKECYICTSDDTTLGDKAVMHFAFDNPYLRLVKQNLAADNVEPKFHEGEWITNGDYTWKIVEVKPLDYILQSQDGNIVDDTISYVDEQFHSFTIADAKDGDVLVSSSGKPFIFKGFFDNDPMAYGGLVADDSFWLASNSNWTTVYCKPATKEQRDILMKAMADAGYTFDFKEKELKKIEQKHADGEMKEVLRTEYEKGKADAIAEFQKAWSEEDEETLGWLCAFLSDYGHEFYGENEENVIDWLKSLKYRVQSKQEWSKEDIRNIENIDSVLFYDKDLPEDTCVRLRNWLKSLRPQSQWKPSDEQIEGIRLARSFVVDDFGEHPTLTEILIELEEQLQKIKENKL